MPLGDYYSAPHPELYSIVQNIYPDSVLVADGGSALVFEHVPGKIIKASFCSASADWLETCRVVREHNPWMPRVDAFVGAFLVDDYREAWVFEMEALQLYERDGHCSEQISFLVGELSRRIEKASRCYKDLSDEDYWRRALPSFEDIEVSDPRLRSAFRSILEIALKYDGDAFVDLTAGRQYCNVMTRPGTGQLVIVDPVASIIDARPFVAPSCRTISGTRP